VLSNQAEVRKEKEEGHLQREIEVDPSEVGQMILQARVII
jgi:hypothetical protein